MFRKNENHQQQRMFTVVDQLPKEAKKRLENSWAHSFYKDFFSRLDEKVFSVLYSEKKSRPNTPVNILMGFETLKSGFGWSDEELYNHFLFDLQVRYALGLHDFDEEYFDLRTIYYFRAALVNYERVHDINLIQRATEKITDEQIEQFKLKTGLQRMDSTQIQSNIRNMSRIQLLVEIIHRFHRVLSKADREKHATRFASYIKEDSLHYCYRLKRDEAESSLQHIGTDLSFFVEEFESGYHGTKEYKDLRRVFGEHFRFEEDRLIIKQGKELSGATLQSPDDPEATYRRKNGENAKGYVANITETCDPDNELQLITAMNVDPNITDDQKLMSDDLAGLTERTEIEEIVTDAGYTGPTANEAIEAHNLKQTTTAIKGRKKKKNKLGLEDFKLTCAENGTVCSIECPNGCKGEVREGRGAGRYSAGFSSSDCMACPLRDNCPANQLKKRPVFVLRFSDNDVRVALQRQRLAENKQALNIRASVESTVRSVIHPFGGHLCKMPVRGKARIKTMAVLSAAMVNIRRITEYLVSNEKNCHSQPAFS